MAIYVGVRDTVLFGMQHGAYVMMSKTIIVPYENVVVHVMTVQNDLYVKKNVIFQKMRRRKTTRVR